MTALDAERERLQAEPTELALWRKWGPYLSDRSWGTVREDYSADCDPWKFFPHEMARSKAYRWGEDGIAGFSDRYQILCWSLAMWNGRDPILKERFFGVVPTEGNHGEDVKECYFYVDALPTHAYQRMVYKYPQAEFPYARLSAENRRRGAGDPELELIDTGVFDDGRYFDVEIEVAKETPESMVMRVTAHNRGPERATIHLIPQLWFRNRWSWGPEPLREPIIRATANGLLADDTDATPLSGLLQKTRLGPRLLEVPAGAELLFTNNETNSPRVFDPSWNSRSPYVKDAFHRYIVNGERGAVNPNREGTKACAWMKFDVEPGSAAVMQMRFHGGQAILPVLDARERTRQAAVPVLHGAVGEIIALRRKEADQFYASIHPPHATDDERNIQRQAFAGMLWNKQSYLFDVDVWLDGDNPHFPPNSNHRNGRNRRWRHLNSMRILSMPDKWEYPWFAAWDLAFHSVVFALIDGEYAKEQLWLMLFEQFQHPNGQIPAYEWEFSDLNPPVQAWAIWRVYNMERMEWKHADRSFLEK
ncbi:MAG: glucosidase, partial [Thermoanaerobaculia bacterium]